TEAVVRSAPSSTHRIACTVILRSSRVDIGRHGWRRHCTRLDRRNASNVAAELLVPAPSITAPSAIVPPEKDRKFRSTTLVDHETAAPLLNPHAGSYPAAVRSGMSSVHV